jgi:23S rRNA pseudouridine1911/1915/1917 synthase
MNKQHILIITEDQHNERLDKFLVTRFPEHSRSYWQKTIKDGGVLVNDKIVPVHHFLSCGEEIKVQTERTIPTIQKEILPEKSREVKIIFETKSYVVVDKPAGIIVHPTDQIRSGTLVNILLGLYPEII